MIERKDPEAESKKCVFTIMGDEYVIRGNDSPEYIEHIVSYVEGTIQSILDHNLKLSKSQIAVLAALKIADELYKLRQEYQYLDDLINSKESR